MKSDIHLFAIQVPTKERLGFLLLAAVIPLAFFAPYLFAQHPHHLFFGDNAILYFPQFVEGYHLARRGALAGIDFLTNNGASAYFLRPNLPSFYPPYYLIYALFRFETISGLASAYVFLWYAHAVLGFYSCARLGRIHFQLGHWASVLLAVLYIGAISRYSFGMPIFYYPAALFPLLLYSAIDSCQTTATWWRVTLRSIPYVVVFLAGYLPVDVNAVALALCFAAFYAWANPSLGSASLKIQIARLGGPFLLACLIVMPIYLAMAQYHSLVPGIPGGVWQAAHDQAYRSHELFSIVSSAFQEARPAGEWPHVNLGILSVILLTLAYSQRRHLGLSPLQGELIAASVFIFVFYLLLAFGQATGLPDLFYFFVPALGKMHFYGRYLLIASFFFFVLVALVLEPLIRVRENLPVARWLFAIAALVVLIQGILEFWPLKLGVRINPGLLVIELVMVAFALICFSTAKSVHAYLGVITISLLVCVANVSSPTNNFSTSAPPPFINHVSNSPGREATLRMYFQQHSSKTLIKFVDVTQSIERKEGIGPNYPWMAQGSQMISNYIGYELGTSVDRDYAALFPYWGVVNFPWLLRTGADFIIYQTTSQNYATEIKDWVDHQVPQLDLGFGYKVAKLRDASGLLDYIPLKRAGDFDNGIFRVSNATGTAAVTEFDTDFVSRVRFQVNSAEPANVRYQLFPNKMMELRVDGRRMPLALKDGLLEVTLPPGRHQVEYVYNNQLNRLFSILYPIYFSLIICIIGWRAWIGWRANRAKKQTSMEARS